jgi:hypothetical protein
MEQSAVAFMGLGAHLGALISQNGKGDVLGHVKQVVAQDDVDISKTRIYRTAARQYFHVDYSDIVGLLCLEPAIKGGESAIASLHHIFNVLQRERPDIVELLTLDTWYCGRRGETSTGQKNWFRQPLIFKTNQGIYSKYSSH